MVKASEKRLNSQAKPLFSKENLELSNVVFVSSNANSSHSGAMLYIFEDNEVAIKMIIKGRSRTRRHVPTGRSTDSTGTPKIQIKYVDTKKKNSQTSEPKEASHVMNGTTFYVSFNISLFSSPSCSQVVKKALPPNRNR